LSGASPRPRDPMRRRAGRLLPLLLAIPAAHASDPLQAIDDCLAHVDGPADVGYERIAARCPELTPALSASAVAAWLPPDWKQPGNALSSRSLGDLRAVLARELSSHETRPAPDAEHVAAVLAAVTESESLRGSWWARLKAWLHEAMIPRQQSGGDTWMRRWASGLSLPQAVRRLIGWAALMLVVGTAVSVVVNELKVAGALAPRGGRRRTAVAAHHSDLSLGAIESAEEGAQPGLLLEFIAARLTAEQRLPAARALTVGELWRRARLPDEHAREQLAELAGVCEQVRFSGAPVASATLSTAVLSGRRVLAALDAASPAAVGT
jgi:hypothetical protein